MSITLKRIELWNIRVHEHFTFTPDEKGITSVSGANGAGKSTIVDAFAWALYGTKTNNTKNKMLIREGVTPKTTYVGVEVEIEVNKIDYLIRRSIVGDGGGADCNVYGRSSFEKDAEFNHLAGPAISSAEKYIKQILKMDEKGFLTAVLIQQKQVDQIVASSPRERGEVIEKLTGIKSISNAIELAKTEARVAQKAASVITTQDTASLKAEIQEKMKEGHQLKDVFDSDEGVINSLKAEVADMTENLEKYNENLQFANDLRVKVDLSKSKEKLLNKEMSSYLELLGDYRKENKTTIVEDIAPIEENFRKLTKELLSIENRQGQLKTRVNEVGLIIESSSAKVSGSKEANLQRMSEVTSAKDSLIAQIEEKSKEVQGLNGEAKQVKKYLDTLGKDVHECPVCNSTLDDPDALRNEILNEIEKIKLRSKEGAKQLKEFRSELANSESELKSLQEQVKLHETIEELKLEVKSLSAEEKKLADEVPNKQAALKVVDEHYTKALKIASRAEEVQRAKERVKEINEQLLKIKDSIKVELETLEKLKDYTNSTSRSETKALEIKKRSLNQLEIKHAKDSGDLQSLRIQVKGLKDKYKSAEDANRKYEQITKAMANANVASSVMSEFKEDRIKVSIPALEMYASTILSKFTEGKFVKLELDSKFNTFVTTDTGKRRPIAQLSGGELSATAIALRIGISMLLNDGDNNVLILDEILVSMDEARARYIIETITSITNCQVIFIAHNTDIQSIADLTVTIEA